MTRTTETETCDRCHVALTDEALAQGWPIAMDDGYICPACYGDEAYCRAGHVLPSDIDSRECPTCEAADGPHSCGSGTVAARHDPRYVAADDPRAVLRAWGGPDATMDMGGWTDTDRAAFEAAVQDESLYGAGERLSHIVIEPVR